MRLAQRIGGTFDLISLPETNTNLVRNANEVRLSWVDDQGRFLQLVKTTPATSRIGSSLVSFGSYLKPTGDQISNRTVAKLLAGPSHAIKSKQIEIDGTIYTAHLLPVQIM